MFKFLNIQPLSKSFKLAIVLSLSVIGIYAYAEYENWVWRYIFFLGLFVIPETMRLRFGPMSWRYALPTLLSLVLLFFIRSSSLFYLACCFSILLFWESLMGRRSFLALVLMLVLSPVVSFIAQTWSFPIRLQLGEWATQSLQLAGMNIVSRGNIVILEGQEFAIDPACMGLQMLITASIIAVFILAKHEQKTNATLPVWRITAALFFMITLTVIANFIRLLALIIFRIMPENLMHDLLGLLSLLVYTLLPFCLWWRWWMPTQQILNPSIVEDKKSGITNPFANSKPWLKGLAYSFFLVLFAITARQFRQPLAFTPPSTEYTHKFGYESSITKEGVIQLKSKEALIYIKPPVRTFQGGHDPRICWQGSGYAFAEVRPDTVVGHEIYTAVLELEGDQLFTAWWYQSGTIRTTNEWEWRQKTLLNGHSFLLINITAETPEGLKKVVAEWLDK